MKDPHLAVIHGKESCCHHDKFPPLCLWLPETGKDGMEIHGIGAIIQNGDEALEMVMAMNQLVNNFTGTAPEE